HSNTTLSLCCRFPFLHQHHTRVPFRNTPPHPTAAHGPKLWYLGHRARLLRHAYFTGTEGPRQTINRSLLRLSKINFRTIATYSLFLSFPFIFPLVEIPFSI